MTVTVEEAEKATVRAEELGLHGVGFKRSLGLEKVAACNGVGPSSWPEEQGRRGTCA